jgi:hypothetical protein
MEIIHTPARRTRSIARGLTLQCDTRHGRTDRRRTDHGLPLSSALALLAAFAVLLTACAPAASATATPTSAPTATPAATRAPMLVFQADWSKGLDGWHATSGWSIAGGVLQSDGGEERGVTIPYQVASGDYAVEYSMQVTSPQPGNNCNFADAPAPDKYGYLAQVTDITSPQAQNPSSTQISLSLDPLPPEQFPLFRDFVPGPDFRTYRIEVHKSTAALFVGRAMFGSVTGKSDRAPTLSGGPFTLTCSGVVARVASLAVYEL